MMAYLRYIISYRITLYTIADPSKILRTNLCERKWQLDIGQLFGITSTTAMATRNCFRKAQGDQIA